MPEFPGGMPALMEFIRKNLRHDKAEKNERVIIQIVVDKKGNATNPVVLRSTNPALDEEALLAHRQSDAEMETGQTSRE